MKFDRLGSRCLLDSLKSNIIIDDGAHDPYRQVTAMKALLPLSLVKAGTYFIEDIRGDTRDISKHLPDGFEHKVYEGSKRLPEGHCERLMIITWR